MDDGTDGMEKLQLDGNSVAVRGSVQQERRTRHRTNGRLPEPNSFPCLRVPRNQHCCARRCFARLGRIVNVSDDGMAEGGQGFGMGIAQAVQPDRSSIQELQRPSCSCSTCAWHMSAALTLILQPDRRNTPHLRCARLNRGHGFRSGSSTSRGNSEIFTFNPLDWSPAGNPAR